MKWRDVPERVSCDRRSFGWKKESLVPDYTN
jgi:hypothetical protein